MEIKHKICGVEITLVSETPVDIVEVEQYVQRGLDKYGSGLNHMKVEILPNDEVALTYHVKQKPFERIRRITGYLVGTINRWNNAKRSEERDRVKHGTERGDL